MKMSVWSLACQQSVLQWYYNEKHLSEFYPQDGGESRLASKLRYCHPVYASFWLTYNASNRILWSDARRAENPWANAQFDCS